MLPAHDLGGGKIHGIETGGAEPADLHAGNGLTETGLQRGEAGDVRAGFADRIDHTEDDVVDHVLSQVVAFLQRLQRYRRQRQRRDFV